MNARQVIKKIGTVILAVSVVFSSFGGSAAASEQKKKITVTPFENQWKYYGQTKTFIQNEQYSLSEEADISNAQWVLGIAGEEVGMQSYILKGNTEEGDREYCLSENAPKFEVKAYETEETAEFYETADNTKELSEYHTSKQSVSILAPKGYLISNKNEIEESNWAEEMETGELKEGKNVITYFLRSNLDDSTRKAIDRKPKQVTVKVDSIAPEIKEITVNDGTDVEADGSISILGEDSAMYYYMVLPANSSQVVTPEVIKENVASGYGIVGFGRVSGGQDATLNFQGLTAKTEYKLYAFLEDDAGNISKMAESSVFSTEKMALKGTVQVSGEVKVGSTVKLEPKLVSNTGELSYQWYRVKLDTDAAERDAAYDETGGAGEDDLVAEDDEEEEEDNEEEDEEEDTEWGSVKKKAQNWEDEITTLDGAMLIEGATSDTYKITREDIGCRLIACVKAENYSGYVAGSTATFVPKLMPTFKKPTVESKMYSPTRKLSAIHLPNQWSWVDNKIVPVYGNSGYRAKFVPSDTEVYQSVIVRIKVPVTKKALKKSMVSIKKTKMYTGKAIKDNFSVRDQKKKLTRDKDFTVEYINNKNLGKGIVMLSGKGNYKGTTKVTYRITKRTLGSVTCRYEKSKVYSGKPVKVGLELENGTVEMKENRDYTVTYKNNTEVGKASIILRGKGNYKGKRKLVFSIVPKKPSIKKAGKKGKNLRLVLSAGKNVTGFYVFVSASRSFKKAKTQQYITTGDRFGIQRMEKGTWYIRVKAYTVRKGKTYVSGYSRIKKVKIK